MTRPLLHSALERLGRVEALDPAVEKVSKLVRDAFPSGQLKDALSGTYAGHAIHPVLTDVPVGTWTSSGLLDALGGRGADAASERLIAVGILAALPTAASGLLDWSDSTVGDREVGRVGLIHAVANTAALALYGASLVARRGGRRRAGKALGAAGLAALSGGGLLGGHLSYSEGVGVRQTAFDDAPAEWSDVGAESELEDDSPLRAQVASTPVMVVRHGGEIFALDARCCHRGGPLDEGEISNGCVTCPLHATVFKLADGSVVHGPAAYPQPAYSVRVRDGRIEVRG
ncbi:MAG: hypothetical protein NVSMB25_02830 [Thermoleophilaceae bacterium]